MIKPTDFTRFRNDRNGNSRFICHFLHLSRNYADACKLANTIGGRKFHNRNYGGGIIFQEYDGLLQSLCDRINAIARTETT